jgi:hypothetical protein
MTIIGKRDEWDLIERLLPVGWQEQARLRGAFQRARRAQTPGDLLRLLLFHAVNDGGLRSTVTQAAAAGLARMSQVGLLKRMRSSVAWLTWIAAELCREFRDGAELPLAFRPRIVDSTTVQAPGARSTDWRLHYALDLQTLDCDWHELTDCHGAELLERVPIKPGDVLLGDRGYARAVGIAAVVKAGGHVIVRLPWNHGRTIDRDGRAFQVLARSRRVRVGQVREWEVRRIQGRGRAQCRVEGRIIAVRLPAPLAHQSERRAARRAARQQRATDPRTLEAAHFVFLFTTLSRAELSARNVLELYRYRWQVELAFKRHKQILKLGQLPHRDPEAAQSWILSKLIVALLLEKLYRSSAISPWGYLVEPTIAASPSKAA